MRRFTKVVAGIGLGAVVILGFDGVTYAATGSSLILGRVNKTVATTTIQNTKNGPALALVTRTTAYPPFTTNAKGLVKNLYANRAVTSDTLGGKTLAQVRSGIDAATVGGKSLAKVQRDCTVPLTPYPGQNLAGCVLSGYTFPVPSDLTGANLVAANLGGVSVFQGNFTGANLRAAKMGGGAGFLSTSFAYADLTDTTWSGSEFSGVALTGADFNRAVLTNSVLTATTATVHADLAHFTGATFINVTCPDGTNSTTHGDTCIGFGAGA